ncbi:MAG: hypothetical protein WAK01_01195 [Methylocystis sp.]
MSNQTLLRLTIGAWALMQACVSAQAATSAPVCATTSNITVAVTPTVTNTFSTITSDFALVYSVNYTPNTPTDCYTVTLISATAATIEGTIAAAGVVGGNNVSSYDVFIAESPNVPSQLAGQYSSLLSGALPFWVATDALDLYSTTVDISAGLPLFPTAFSVPNPATLDPYGRATVEALKGGWPRALAKGLPITADDALSSWSAVEYGFGIPAYGFTGKSQICTNIGNGGESYEDGSFHHEYVYGKDYVTALAWTGLKLNQLSNGAVVARTTQAENAVNAFISFLSQASVTVPNHTPGGGGGTTTLDGGKTGLGQSCLKTTR